MSDAPRLSSGAHFVIILAACVVIIAGLKAADALAVTFFLSALIALICVAPFSFLRARGFPAWATFSLLALAIVLAQVIFVTILATSITEFSNNLPEYQQRLQVLNEDVVHWLQAHGLSLSVAVMEHYFSPASIVNMAGSMLSGLGVVISNAMLVTLTVIFMLLEGKSFPAKLQRAFAGRVSLQGTQRFIDNINRYVTIKTAVSLATGALIAFWTWVVGLDFPLFWGVLAFLLNVIPNIGSIIAAVPAVLLALIQLGPIPAILIGCGYLLVNLVLGNILEPRYMGRGLGLSTLMVWLSLVFWGWVLGPIGMLLSVPLSMALQIALESRDETRWLAVLMAENRPSAEVGISTES